jgi:hypothetical protein
MRCIVDDDVYVMNDWYIFGAWLMNSLMVQVEIQVGEWLMHLIMVQVDDRLFGTGCYGLVGCRSVVQVVAVVYLTMIV